MNTIKRFNLGLTLLLTAFIFLSSNLLAQQRQGQGPPPIPDETQINKMVEDLSSELSLTATQKTEILALYTNHFAEAKSAMDGERKSREEMQTIRANFEKKIMSLLTDDQQELFKEYEKNNQKRNGEGRQRR